MVPIVESYSYTSEIQTPAIVVQEPLEPYVSFLRKDTEAVAYSQGCIAPYLRWQLVERGAPLVGEIGHTGYAGYIVGFSPDHQHEILQGVGESMLEQVAHVAKRRCVPVSNLLMRANEGKWTPGMVSLIEPIFASSLAYMRTVGNSGMDTQGYSLWRTQYEQEVWQIEERMKKTQSTGEQQMLSTQLTQKHIQLRDRLHHMHTGSGRAQTLYSSYHQHVLHAVDIVMSTQKTPLKIDPVNNTIQYTLPSDLGPKNVGESPLSEGAPDWLIAIKKFPTVGHPIIRAKIYSS